MKQTIGLSQFRDAFRAHGREGQFSREGLGVLFDYLEQLEQDTGEDFELDVIGLCCDFMEADEAEIRDMYSIDEDEDVEEYLSENTMLCGRTSAGDFVFQQF